jgi:hypothetical protein
MGFSRKDAVDFADTHWNTPADDGLFWLSNQAVVIAQVRASNVIPVPFWKKAPAADGWQPFFVDDGSGGENAVFRRVVGGVTEEILINPWAGIADCAHFLSRCLRHGGLDVAERGVPSLINKLQSLSNAKTLCEKVDQVAGQRVIDSKIFKPGDMVGYFNIDPSGDYGGAKQYAHSTMFVGKLGSDTEGKVTCHTICRFPGRSWVEDRWWLQPPGHYQYTLIHFTDDDPVPNAAKVKDLVGWWKLEYSGRTEYYLMQAKGFVQYTKIAPKKGQFGIGAADGSAYWFMSTIGEITFTWRNSGTVEVWKPDGGGYKSTINGVIPGVLTKLP